VGPLRESMLPTAPRRSAPRYCPFPELSAQPSDRPLLVTASVRAGVLVAADSFGAGAVSVRRVSGGQGEPNPSKLMAERFGTI
jgi:hypothetical protein